jgi:molybdenum cofactor biosynthesis protein B
MSTTVDQHHATSPQHVRCAVITVSDTRTLENDTGGQAMIEHLAQSGHVVVLREIVRDDPAVMRPLLESLGKRDDVDAILLTGGTGIASRDQTFETVTSMLTKPLSGYGELFRMLSYAEIGAAAMLSRATGGLMGKKVVLTMPGSPAGVRLAMEKLIATELGHLVREARR